MINGGEPAPPAPVKVVSIAEEAAALNGTARADGAVFLATRHSGALIRRTIEVLPAGQVPILDWEGITGITGAFADELVGKLLDSGRPYGTVNITAGVREVIDATLRRRSLDPGSHTGAADVRTGAAVRVYTGRSLRRAGMLDARFTRPLLRSS